MSPWLQAYDELCDFGGLLAPSPKAFNHDTSKTEVPVSGAARIQV